jgi:hypothetical protein
MSEGREAPPRRRIFKVVGIAWLAAMALVVLYAVVALILIALGVWGGA